MRRLAAQPVILPAITFGVQVRLAEATLTEIEAFTLEAIGLGVGKVDALAQIFGLGRRPTLDLIYDLWRAGYVQIASDQHIVRLAGRAAALFREGRLRELDSAERVVRPVYLIQELLTGAVLPWVGDTRPEGPDSALIPAVLPGLDLSRVSRDALEEAVERQLGRERRSPRAEPEQRGSLKVLEIWPAPEQLIAAPTQAMPGIRTRRFVGALADVWLDVDTSTLGFELVHAPDLSPTQRRDISRALSLRAVSDAPLIFYKRLREGLTAGADVAGRAAARDAIQRLQRATSALTTANPGTVTQRHEELRGIFFDALDEISSLELAQARVTVLVGHAEHDEALRQLARRSSSQLILANPWVSLEGLIEDRRGESWFDVLDAALRRGVRVVLLWGIAEDARLPEPVQRALDDLRNAHPGLLVCAAVSAHLHAKVLVRDGVEAIVTSYNFLQPPRGGEPLELGLIVAGMNEGECPSAVQSLLNWARERYPEHRERRQIATLPENLGARSPSLPELPDEPELPILDAEGLDPTGRALAVRLWSEHWSRVADRLARRAAALGEGVRLVQGAEHRDALWSALRSAHRRLAVLSDRLSVDVVTDRFIRELRSRLDAGVPCALLFRREGAADSAAGPAARLVSESERSPDLCRLTSARSHAKVLVQDDVIVLGSYNFLSYGADEKDTDGRSQRAELSLRVQDAALVDRILSVLEEHSPGVFKPLLGRGGRAALHDLDSIPASLQPLLRALHDPAPGGAQIQAWFARSSTPWADLDALAAAGAAQPLLERGVWGALATAPAADPKDKARWQATAAHWRWAQGDLIGAALLLPTPAPPEATLPPWLAALGAAVQQGSIGELSLEEPASPDEAAAALALLLAPILLEARWGLLDQVSVFAHHLPRELSSWPDALDGFKTEGRGAPLDLPLVQRRADQSVWQLEVKRSREAFREALESALQVGFTFPIGKHTWDVLQHPGRLLDELAGAHAANDPARLRRALERWRAAGQSAEGLMDEASGEVRDQHNHRIEPPKREVCVQRLSRAWLTAERWVTLSVPPASAVEERQLLAARSLAQGLSALDALDLLADGALAAPALAHARSRLRPLLMLRERE